MCSRSLISVYDIYQDCIHSGNILLKKSDSSKHEGDVIYDHMYKISLYIFKFSIWNVSKNLIVFEMKVCDELAIPGLHSFYYYSVYVYSKIPGSYFSFLCSKN